MFPEKALAYLGTCWCAGRTPGTAVLRQDNVQDPSPFPVMNYQFNYVERRGVFAGLWFEEIDGVLSR